MTREEVKKFLVENGIESPTDKQIDVYLDLLHKNKDYEKINREYLSLQEKFEKEELAKKSKEEQLIIREQLIVKKEKEAQKLINEIKAKNILINAGIDPNDVDSDLLDGIVSDNSETTIKRAERMANLHKQTVEKITKITKEELLSANTLPGVGNADPNDGDVMTKEKFLELTYSQAEEFRKSNPIEFQKFLET